MNTERLFIRIISTNVLLDPVNVCDICFFSAINYNLSPLVTFSVCEYYVGWCLCWGAQYVTCAISSSVI